jgi:hypothetical protein
VDAATGEHGDLLDLIGLNKGSSDFRETLEEYGSEVRSVELESLIAQGEALLDRRAAFERMRDLAAERYEAETGSAWRPRAGSLVNHRHLTAGMIDSRDFIAARGRADTELLQKRCGPRSGHRRLDRRMERQANTFQMVRQGQRHH